MPSLPQPRKTSDAQERLLTTPIVKPVQLLVEGGNDLALVQAMLAEPAAAAAFARIQVHACGGKQSIKAMLDTLATLLPDTPAAKVVVLRDADANVELAQAECIGYFRDSSYPFPGMAPPQDWPMPLNYLQDISTEWLLIPGQGHAGTLETLVLAALAGDPGVALASTMLSACIAARGGQAARWPGPKAEKHGVVNAMMAEKAQLQAFLAAFARKGYRLPSSAFEEGVLDVLHPAFAGIRQQVLAL